MPYWICEREAGARIERRIRLLPMSRNQPHLRRLKGGLAIYRLAFGQPRQEELLSYLTRRFDQEQAEHLVERYRIWLAPPALELGLLLVRAFRVDRTFFEDFR